MPRLEKQPILYQEKLNENLPEKLLRFSTPKEPALYRANKLRCNTIVDIGAGIGGQAFAFAKNCKKVIAVEINKKYAGLLINNLKKLNIKNVRVIIGDALNPDIIERIKAESPDIIFCDTERKPEGKRSINDLNPNVKELIKKYSLITNKIAIEIPPFTQDIDKELKKEKFEKEFLSLYGKLNRLTLYFNSLKTCDVSVVALPGKQRIEGSNKDKIKKIKPISSAVGFAYLYEINPAITLAGIVEKLAENVNLLEMNNKSFFLSKDLIKSAFLINYKILAVTDSSQESILENLKKHDVGKVVIRYSINPEQYWKTRNFYENHLNKSGKEVNLFINEKTKEALICERI